MVTLFSEKDKNKARNQKKQLLIFWFCLLAIYLVLVGLFIGLNIYQVNVLRSRENHVLFAGLSMAFSIIFAGFSFFFFSIKYRLTRKYVKMINDMDKGLTDEETVKFMDFSPTVVTKDGVYFYGMVCEARPLKREDIATRTILIEQSIELPDFYPGDRIRVVTHANILLSYKVVIPQERKEEYVKPQLEYYNKYNKDEQEESKAEDNSTQENEDNSQD